MNRMEKQTETNHEMITDAEAPHASGEGNELELAWLWFAERAASDEARHYCFERALLANPASQPARQGLEHLRQKRAAQNQPAQTGQHPAAQLSRVFRQRNSKFVVE